MERNIIKITVSTVLGYGAFLLGGLDGLLKALLILMIMDYISGVLKAIHNRSLSSEIGFNGIVKKIFLLIIIALAFLIEEITSHSLPIREVTIMFFIVNEGISILENAELSGVPIPKVIRRVLAKLQEED